ncbi:MAG: hypothetical protein CVV41_09335 [Candidatus Riflebacteria bacterium HGW-Riflebacteria-1]|nr:MAG: hypothetical protein CVV41_09335 [Candidatus Riflebacteria bacterium HGW-Riflebacteria-1]
MKTFYQKFSAILCGAAMLLGSFAAAEEPGLYPLRTEPDGNHVYIDSKGKVKFAVSSTLTEEFSQGFAAVCESDSWHFIDKTGKKAFGKDFDEIRAFSEGLAAVKKGELWGYIDLTGKMAVEAKFARAYKFSEGLACVMIGDFADGSARYGYIDNTGKYVIEPFLRCLDNQYFSPPGEFSDGLAAAWLPLNSDGDYMVGYINKEGKTAIAPKFTVAGKFVDGLAPASILLHDEVPPTGFIDKSGNFVIQQAFSHAFHFSEGLAPASTFDPKYEAPEIWGYIDSKGKWVIKPAYEMAEHFVGGLARVYDQLSSGGEVYIKKDGSIVANSAMIAGKQSDNAGLYKLNVKSISASSFLPQAKDISYKPENILDGNPETAWVEGSKSMGVGEWLSFNFAEPVEIHSINIWNGYQKAATAKRDPFKANLSVAKIRFTQDGKSSEHELKNERGAQTIKLGGAVTSSVKIEILAVHESKADPDCCLSEIEFTGRVAP